MIDPNDFDAWNNKCNGLYNSGKYDQAIKWQAIEIKPENADAYNGKGAAYSGLGKYDEAIKCFDKVIGIKEMKRKNIIITAILSW